MLSENVFQLTSWSKNLFIWSLHPHFIQMSYQKIVFSFIFFVWCRRNTTCRRVHMSSNLPSNVERHCPPAIKWTVRLMIQMDQRRIRRVGSLSFYLISGKWSTICQSVTLSPGTATIAMHSQCTIGICFALSFWPNISSTISSAASCVSWISINVESERTLFISVCRLVIFPKYQPVAVWLYFIIFLFGI